jgi:uncharacterized protein
MLILISSAKTLDFKAQNQTLTYTIPEFIKKSEILVHELRKLKPENLMQLFDINFKLAQLNAQRYITWHLPFTPENAKLALLAFKGEVYRGIKADTYNTNDLKYAQNHLRILSGLYGLLRPLDLIQPYRMEMGIPFKTVGHKTIYGFWDNTLTNSLNQHLNLHKINTLVNLASNEYFKAIDVKKLKAKIITPVFMESKGEKLKTIVVYLKKARGLMTSFIIKNRITNPEEIKHFDLEGYNYVENFSDEERWVFVR